MTDDLERAVGQHVSRETRERLEEFTRLISLWNPRINLVSRATLSDIWSRHVIDSAQLLSYAGAGTRTWGDIGSGGGFPGLVIAIIARELYPELHLSLIESDARKVAFLREAARATDTVVSVVNARAEVVHPMNMEIVSSRAVAPLVRLLALAEKHVADGGICVFLKGSNAQEEIVRAREVWLFDVGLSESISNAQGQVLRISRLRHV